MPDEKSTNGASQRKSSPRNRGSKREHYTDRSKLRGEVLKRCRTEVDALGLPPVQPRRGGVPEVERKARAVYARARRALRALLAAVPAGTVSGPCTRLVHDHRAAIEALVGDRGTHLRTHSAQRTSPVAATVDAYGTLRVTIGDELRALTPRELACLALLAGAPLPAGEDTVEACLDAVTRAVREDKRRHAKARRIGVPSV